MHGATVSVIIPTLASRERGERLLRAIRSAQVQEDVAVIPIVIANGENCDPELIATLKTRRDIRFFHAEEPSLPLALKLGRDRVDTPYFSEVDDDDELLPLAFRSRLEPMAEDRRIDAVVSNAIVRNANHDGLSIPDVARVRNDPLRALMESNWLAPGSALFRTEAVPPDVFARIPKYLEWTYLALILAMHHKLHFLERPTAVHYKHLPFSVDDSRECALERPGALKKLLELEMPDEIRYSLMKQLGAMYHKISNIHLDEGSAREAWLYHLKSVACRNGWIYLSYTRHLIGKRRGLHTP